MLGKASGQPNKREEQLGLQMSTWEDSLKKIVMEKSGANEVTWSQKTGWRAAPKGPPSSKGGGGKRRLSRNCCSGRRHCLVIQNSVESPTGLAMEK